jgi:hypothetical protein
MNKILITQPTFLPWLGYFDLIDQADILVFLDDVQLDKRSWQTRNKIKLGQIEKWITIPILSKNLSKQKIRDTLINNEQFKINKLFNLILHSYGKSKFYSKYNLELFDILKSATLNFKLIELNLKLINFLLLNFGINKNIYYSSSLNIDKKKSSKIIEICKKFKCNFLISTYGSRSYLEEDVSFFKENKIKIFLHNYDHPIYKQVTDPFISHISALDLLFNEGPKSIEIIRSGRKKLIEI